MKPIRTLVGPIIIAALVVTGVSTAQARAETSDLAKFLIGLAAVAAIASAVDNDANANTTPSATTSRAYDDYRYSRRHHKRYALPAACLRIYETRRGEARLFSPRCLERNTSKLAKLPKNCRRAVQTRRGPKWAFSPRCLRRAGFFIVQPRDWDYARDYRGDRQTNTGTHIVWGN